MTRKSLIVLAMLCLAPLAAFAEEPAPPTAAPAQASEGSTPSPAKGKRWQACAAELEKFCSTVEKGKGLKRACLESHSAELSEGCKTSLAERAARAKEEAGQ
jgi:curli biogenesis system outer membrane secretion channel CsgG